MGLYSKIYYGTNKITTLRYNESRVKQAYHGSTLIYASTQFSSTPMVTSYDTSTTKSTTVMTTDYYQYYRYSQQEKTLVDKSVADRGTSSWKESISTYYGSTRYAYSTLSTSRLYTGIADIWDFPDGPSTKSSGITLFTDAVWSWTQSVAYTDSWSYSTSSLDIYHWYVSRTHYTSREHLITTMSDITVYKTMVLRTSSRTYAVQSSTTSSSGGIATTTIPVATIVMI